MSYDISLTDPSPDQLRAIARTARNSSGSASDDCGALAYVLHGWRAAAIAFRAQQAALVEAQQPAQSAAAIRALDAYNSDTRDADPGSPLERLRFFCSLAMNGQDWLDAEQFFNELAAQPSLAPQADSQPAPATQQTGESVAIQWLAEMIMSDCGCSTQNQRLLDRIIDRITQYERANTSTQSAGGAQAPMIDAEATAYNEWFNGEQGTAYYGMWEFARAAWMARAARAPADSQPAPDLDMAVMQLAESVGLIGPASRTHDLHAAIQRFHDLICVNATIKAAVMAADAIRGAARAPADSVTAPAGGVVAWLDDGTAFAGSRRVITNETKECMPKRLALAYGIPLYTTPQPTQVQAGAVPQCWCLTCRPMRLEDPYSIRMALCPTCGNKRCPKANDHRNECTGSNEPGQPGSAYSGGIKGGQHGL